MAYNPFTLEGKTILVTGAAGGIGRATSVECAKLGAKLLLTDINEAGLQETLSMLDGTGHLLMVADLTSQDALDNLVAELPMLDGFVSNAGIIKTILTQFGERTDLERILGINTVAPIRLTQILLQNKRFNKEADKDSADMVHDSVIFLSHENTLTKRYEDHLDDVLQRVGKLIPKVGLTGQWSVDIMLNGDDLWLIDMAIAENSAFYDCVPEEKRRPAKENWIPKLPAVK